MLDCGFSAFADVVESGTEVLVVNSFCRGQVFDVRAWFASRALFDVNRLFHDVHVISRNIEVILVRHCSLPRGFKHCCL